jgi:hypothetical protein
VAQAGFVEIDPSDGGFPDSRGKQQTLEHLVADEALIDASQRLHEPLKHALQSADDCREVLQQAPAVELSDIMSNGLDTKYTFAL